MHHGLIPYLVGKLTFGERYTEDIRLYPNPAPRSGDKPYIRWLDFVEDDELAEWLAETTVSVGDVLELLHVDRRLAVYGVNVQVIGTSEGLVLTPVFRSGANVDEIDCTYVSKNTYLLGGGVLDESASLSDKSFVTDAPDYLGLRIDALGDGLTTAALKVTLVTGQEFPGTLPSNKLALEEIL